LARSVADEAFFVGQQGIVLDEIDTAKFDGRHEDLLLKWVPRTGRAPVGKHMTVAGREDAGQCAVGPSSREAIFGSRHRFETAATNFL